MAKKKSARTPAKKAATAKAKRAQELSAEQLEQVAGGAKDYLLIIDGIKGETELKQKHSLLLNLAVTPNPFQKLKP
jgi:hypothetical protein